MSQTLYELDFYTCLEEIQKIIQFNLGLFQNVGKGRSLYRFMGWYCNFQGFIY